MSGNNSKPKEHEECGSASRMKPEGWCCRPQQTCSLSFHVIQQCPWPSNSTLCCLLWKLKYNKTPKIDSHKSLHWFFLWKWKTNTKESWDDGHAVGYKLYSANLTMSVMHDPPIAPNLQSVVYSKEIKTYIHSKSAYECFIELEQSVKAHL